MDNYQFPGTPPPRRRRHPVRNGVLAGLGCVAVLAVALSLSSSPARPAAATSTTTPQAWTSPPTAPTPPSSSATTAPATSALSPQKLQALETALGYLSDGQGFSKAGLIQQLSSPYGNQYPHWLARWAVDKLSSARVWRHQAALSAEGYATDGQGFSCSGLVQQLDSQYGGQFTYAQAEFGAHAAKVC